MREQRTLLCLFIIWQMARRNGFACLWDSLNAKRGYSWESNPWVWMMDYQDTIMGNIMRTKDIGLRKA